MPTAHDFDLAATQQRAGLAATSRDDQLLIRCATLAASSHNTQPWMFQIAPDAITISPDLSRRCRVVDPDDAHLFKSLGCAAENLVVAAEAQGLAADARFDPENDAVIVSLTPSESRAQSDLFEAISTRQCTRLPFDGTPVSPEDLTTLQEAGTVAGVRTSIVTDRAVLAAMAEVVADGNVLQLRDGDFRRELLSWIRFNPTAALRTGDGLAGRCTGNPSLPTWLGRRIAPVVIRPRAQAARDSACIDSSAGIAVFVAEHDDKSAWVHTGRAYERFALRAAVLDVRTAFVNQPIEVRSLRARFESLLGLDGEHALLAVRFGHGDLAPYSLRRPVDEVARP